MRDMAEQPRGGSVRQLVVLLALGFIVTLGVVVGTRMSSDAIAVLVGVIAGVAASIPCALLLMAVTRRRETEAPLRYGDQQYEDRRYNDRRYSDRIDPRRAAPPVVIVTPGNATPQQWPYAAAAFPYQATQPRPQSQRQFRVMGYEEADSQLAGSSAAPIAWKN
jgi:hypothetical protein